MPLKQERDRQQETDDQKRAPHGVHFTNSDWAAAALGYANVSDERKSLRGFDCVAQRLPVCAGIRLKEASTGRSAGATQVSPNHVSFGIFVCHNQLRGNG